MNPTTAITIVGAGGRMGRAIAKVALVEQPENYTVVAAIERAGSVHSGADLGTLAGAEPSGLKVSDTLAPPAKSVVIDFSLPEATAYTIAACRQAQVPLVLGTTGLPDEIVTELDAAARSIPIVYAANYSVGVTVLAELCARAARALGRDWQAELIELHHRHKRDAPSGTALRLVEAIASARHQNAREVVRCERASRATPRTAEEIGVAALRGGDAVGEHTAMFLAEGERLELIHRANDRAIFARGAVRAASWVVSQPPGLYGMTHVLGMHEP